MFEIPYVFAKAIHSQQALHAVYSLPPHNINVKPHLNRKSVKHSAYAWICGVVVFWVNYILNTLHWNDHHHCRYHPVSRNVKLNLKYWSICTKGTFQAVHNQPPAYCKRDNIIWFSYTCGTSCISLVTMGNMDFSQQNEKILRYSAWLLSFKY